MPAADDHASLTIRPGGPEHVDWLLGLFDEAVAWMVARGQPGQWGTELYIELLLVSRRHAHLDWAVGASTAGRALRRSWPGTRPAVSRGPARSP